MNEGSSSDYTALTSAVTGMITDVKTPILTVLGAGVVILGIFIAWKLIKRGVNRMA